MCAVWKGGMAENIEWYSVPAVARMLGISERAIRGRIERGSLTAELTDGQWRIPISALPNDKPEGGTLGGTSRGTPNDVSGMGGMADGMDTAPLVDARQQAQADAVLQRVLAPFIEQLTATNQELGKVRAERDVAITARAEAERISEVLREQLATASSRSAILHQTTEVSAPLDTQSDGSAVAEARRRSWFHRLLHSDFDGSPRQSEMSPVRPE